MMVCFFMAFYSIILSLETWNLSFRNHNLAQGLIHLAQKIVFLVLHHFRALTTPSKKETKLRFPLHILYLFLLD